jgi:hypothetical protein
MGTDFFSENLGLRVQWDWQNGIIQLYNHPNKNVAIVINVQINRRGRDMVSINSKGR